MKSKLIVYTTATAGALTLLWLAGAVVRWRNPQIVLPTAQVEGAVEVITERRAQEEAQARQAQADQVFQNELLAAHAAVKGALADWRATEGQLACARAQHIMQRWQAVSTETGKGLEVIYRDELNAHMERLRQWQQQTNGTIAGSPDAIAKARAMVLDTQVMLTLGDLMYSGQSAPLCDGSIAQEIHKLSLVSSEVAARADFSRDRIQELEQQQLEQARAFWADQQEAPAPVEASTAPNRLYDLMFGGGANDQQ